MFANQDHCSAAEHTEALHLNSFENAPEKEFKNIRSFVPLRRSSRLVRVFRIHTATLYLIFVTADYRYLSGDSGISIGFTSTLIFWDLVNLIYARSRLSTIPLEVNLLLEFTFLGLFLYLGFVIVLEVIVDNPYHVPFEAVLCFSILPVGAYYVYSDIRAYPTHWRYKRDYRKIKPAIAFTETGNLVAVFPPSQEALIQRFSIDSLQGV
ncbi:hypothetical protein GGR51DRAFT_544315 [Nemania sp. FL0031]|nr:hypothetical protein GGR51DRAFT_544315 [Nemania sp. FL0031]